MLAKPPVPELKCCDHHAPPPPSTGSRRRRLWDIDSHAHCPLVGVSIPLDVLRRLVNKAVGGNALVSDYEVHAGAVSECGRRTRLSELMQADLETRYAREVLAFKAAKTTMELAELWVKHLKCGEVSGAFWAALTHPRCDMVLQEGMCRDLHMFQHQAGAGVRLEIAKFNALADENAVLARELAKVQERSTRLIASKAAESEKLQAEVVRARADVIGKDSQIAYLAQDLATLQAASPSLEENRRLQKRVLQQAHRQVELEAQVTELRRKLAAAERVNLQADHAAAMAERALPKPIAEPSDTPLHLQEKVVLCVGGRSGNIANYRDVVERVGGRFTHHDGGLEDNSSALDANLAAADLVICQTGCISHNAYWRVKDFCKRTGKQCVFVENPSASSLERGLAQIAMPIRTIPQAVSAAEGR